jgi:hypothetical protein
MPGDTVHQLLATDVAVDKLEVRASRQRMRSRCPEPACGRPRSARVGLPKRGDDRRSVCHQQRGDDRLWRPLRRIQRLRRWHDGPPGLDVAYSADVTDPSAPTLIGPSGPLWSGGYHQEGNESASFGGTDNTGISEAAWFVDGRQQTQDRGACDYTRTVPCPDMSADTSHTADLGAFPEGPHQLQAAIKDAAGNATTAGPITITIDRTAPGSPAALAVVGGDASHAANSFDVTWSNPADQLAPIARAHYYLCPAFGGGCTPEATASGDNISLPAYRSQARAPGR